jgi:dimethylargininase
MIPEETSIVSHAITCPPGKNFGMDFSYTGKRPDYETALAQHQKYCEALKKCGVEVLTLSADPLFPDGCFISNMAIVTEYLAVIGNFSDNSPRQGEQKNIATALTGDKFLKFITAPGRLDGADVLQVGNCFYASLSGHTNAEGIRQLKSFLGEYGYEVKTLDLSGETLVRLNTAATYLGNGLLLVREELSRYFSFTEFDKIVVSYKERGAANALMVNDTLLLPAGYPETLAEIKLRSIPVMEVDISEFEKIGGGLGALSLRPPSRQTKTEEDLGIGRITGNQNFAA